MIEYLDNKTIIPSIRSSPYGMEWNEILHDPLETRSRFDDFWNHIDGQSGNPITQSFYSSVFSAAFWDRGEFFETVRNMEIQIQTSDASVMNIRFSDARSHAMFVQRLAKPLEHYVSLDGMVYSNEMVKWLDTNIGRYNFRQKTLSGNVVGYYIRDSSIVTMFRLRFMHTTPELITS